MRLVFSPPGRILQPGAHVGVVDGTKALDLEVALPIVRHYLRGLHVGDAAAPVAAESSRSPDYLRARLAHLAYSVIPDVAGARCGRHATVEVQGHVLRACLQALSTRSSQLGGGLPGASLVRVGRQCVHGPRVCGARVLRLLRRLRIVQQLREVHVHGLLEVISQVSVLG